MTNVVEESRRERGRVRRDDAAASTACDRVALTRERRPREAAARDGGDSPRKRAEGDHYYYFLVEIRWVFFFLSTLRRKKVKKKNPDAPKSLLHAGSCVTPLRRGSVDLLHCGTRAKCPRRSRRCCATPAHCVTFTALLHTPTLFFATGSCTRWL